MAIKGESVYHLRGIVLYIECVASGVSMGKESATILTKLSFELYFADIVVPYLMMMCLYSFFSLY